MFCTYIWSFNSFAWFFYNIWNIPNGKRLGYNFAEWLICFILWKKVCEKKKVDFLTGSSWKKYLIYYTSIDIYKNNLISMYISNKPLQEA